MGYAQFETIKWLASTSAAIKKNKWIACGQDKSELDPGDGIKIINNIPTIVTFM